MQKRAEGGKLYQLRLWPKDLGVAAVVLVALLLGWLLESSVGMRSVAFKDPGSPFQMQYPAGWVGGSSLQDALLKVENPLTVGAYKTTLTVVGRDLDPRSLPTLQTLVDRRIAERGRLQAYHLLNSRDATVGGSKAVELEYAYVVQPIDAPRRATLPVVVHAREYVVLAPDHSYYVTLAAPEAEFTQASRRFDQLLTTVKVQP